MTDLLFETNAASAFVDEPTKPVDGRAGTTFDHEPGEQQTAVVAAAAVANTGDLS